MKNNSDVKSRLTQPSLQKEKNDIVKEFYERKYFSMYHEKLELFTEKEKLLANGTSQYLEKEQIYASKKLELENKEKQLSEAEERRDNYISIMFSFNQTAIKEAKEFKEKGEKEIRQKFNMSVEDFLEWARKKIDEGRVKLEEARAKLDNASLTIKEKTGLLEEARVKLAGARRKLDMVQDLLWAATHCLFIVGAIIGAFTAKHVIDKFGLKKGILFHYVFAIIGGVLVISTPFSNKIHIFIPAIFVKLSRFFYGLQGGMASILIPSYLGEIAPKSLGSKIGLFHLNFLAVGICVAQALGLKQVLGTEKHFHLMLSVPLWVALVGVLFTGVLLPEAPRILLDYDDSSKAEKVLRKLRKNTDITAEIDEMYDETNELPLEKIRFHDVVNNKKFHWPVIFAVVLHSVQHFCGIEAILFYSYLIFDLAGLSFQQIQYAILLTGIVYFLFSAFLVPCVNKKNWRIFLLLSMILMAVSYGMLTVLIKIKGDNKFYGYWCVACVLIALVCFSIGLGPVPFIYVSEVFKDDYRSSPLFLCVVSSWLASFLVILDFPFLIKIMQCYVFLIFVGVLLITILIVLIKIPKMPKNLVNSPGPSKSALLRLA